MIGIRDAIVPVAGLGTRLLPATRSAPKEMLPIVDKPVVQYVVEELAEAGIDRLLMVTGRRKRAIEDHFDADPELGSEPTPATGMRLLYDIGSARGYCATFLRHALRHPELGRSCFWGGCWGARPPTGRVAARPRRGAGR